MFSASSSAPVARSINCLRHRHRHRIRRARAPSWPMAIPLMQGLDMASVLVLGAIALMLNLASISSAQPHRGCKTRCGDIEIPYPFGIGAGCAIEQGFEISCSRTANGIERPFINYWEVLSISASGGQSRVLMFIPTYCYNSSTGQMDSYLWDFYLVWPYRISDVHNKFISIGCNTIGYIYNTEKSTRYATGCVSVCGSPGDLKNGSCVGVGCCQNTVPKDLTSYHVYFYDVDYVDVSNSWHFNPCSYAMVVEAETFTFNSEFITTKRFNDTYEGRQPVVLDWVIGNATCEVARRNMSSYACRSENTVCVDSSNAQVICATAPLDTKGILTSLVDAQMSMNVSTLQAPVLILQLAETQLEGTIVHVPLAAVLPRK
uniref:Wall-associated receptor kinase galacturonan-binding domain-containing protein n=2 Tax=Aegilops tauschii subsp. strangulata TaxID=200361 RepID=A0A453LFN3_AEGTS